MKIQVRRVYENNLKHISVDIPLYQIQTKTVRDALRISDFVKAEEVSHMPLPIFIAAKNVVSNSMSTVSTVSGIQEILRNLFTSFGQVRCPDCGGIAGPAG